MNDLCNTSENFTRHDKNKPHARADRPPGNWFTCVPEAIQPFIIEQNAFHLGNGCAKDLKGFYLL